MKGLMFKPDMLRATIEDRKNVTRRLSGLEAVNVEPDKWHLHDLYESTSGKWWALFTKDGEGGKPFTFKSRYLPGETVYLKETWADMVCVASTVKGKGKGESSPIYKSSADSTELKILAGHWRSPMMMPEWAARYHVKIISVRPERVQEITDEDAAREGCTVKAVAAPGGFFPSDYRSGTLKNGFAQLWNSINKKMPWDFNPWVWRIEYERVG